MLKLYDESLNKIQNKIGKNYIWVSIDEITDSYGRNVANFIIGGLNENQSTQYTSIQGL